MIQTSIKDKSDYLKGLLVLSKKDRSLSSEERTIVKEAGNRLGFASDFINESLFNLLQNKNIAEEPIQFSNKEMAETFISDGLAICFCDTENPAEELNWLKKVAEINQIDLRWLENEITKKRKLKIRNLK
ncbi:MAG: hypothetical protein NTX22_06400 [Ignavibacteriales bacterium]|nr:hypothetical protein [Ignavibacteriales bacterium]